MTLYRSFEEKGIRWIKSSNRHKQCLLPDKRHVFEVFEHGGFLHLSVYVLDKHGALWLRMENRYAKDDPWTERYVDLALELACQVYSDPHKRMDEFERSVDKLSENRNQGGTV